MRVVFVHVRQTYEKDFVTISICVCLFICNETALLFILFSFNFYIESGREKSIRREYVYHKYFAVKHLSRPYDRSNLRDMS